MKFGLAIIAICFTCIVLFSPPLFSATTECISFSPNGYAYGMGQYVSLSTDGQTVAFDSDATKLAPGVSDYMIQMRVYVKDRRSGITECVSIAPDGSEACSHCSHPSISGDGRFVAFECSAYATNMGPSSMRGSIICVRDRKKKTTECVSISPYGTAPSTDCSHPSISADGRFVAYESSANNLTAAYSCSTISQIYVFDRMTKRTECVSLDNSNWGGGNLSSTEPDISANGRFIAFRSYATNLVSGISDTQVYVRDREAKCTKCVSTAGSIPSNLGSFSPCISNDGRIVAFVSSSTNLVAGVSGIQIYAHDLQTGMNQCVSRADNTTAVIYGYSGSPCISSDGRYVAFESDCCIPASGVTSNMKQIYVCNRVTGYIECVSISGQGNCGQGGSQAPSISGDGRLVGFSSFSTNLVSGVTGGYPQIYVRDRGPAQKTLLAGTTADHNVYLSLDAASWTNIPGKLSQVLLGDIYDNGTNDLVGIAQDGTIWCSTGTPLWKQIPGKLNSIALGDFTGSGSKGIVGLTADGSISYSNDLQHWANIPGQLLSSIVIGNFVGDGRDGVAGIACDGTVWYSPYLSDWQQIPGQLVKIQAADLDMDGKDDLIGVASDQTIWYTTDENTWIRIPGRLTDIVVGDFTGSGVSIAGIAYDGSVWYTTDKQNWTQIPGHLKSITVVDIDGWDEIAGTSSDGQIWYTKDLQGWTRIPGVLSTLHSERF